MVTSDGEYLHVKYSSLGEMHSSASLAQQLWGQVSQSAFSNADARQKKKHTGMRSCSYSHKYVE